MREWVILSGKGGTGKTSLAAAFATLADKPVMLTDCDVDAADLHLLVSPVWQESIPFYAGYEAQINRSRCTQCGACQQACRFHAIEDTAEGYRIHGLRCEGCGVCQTVCTQHAVDLLQPQRGIWRSGQIRSGYFMHAQLNPGAENSGKLVATVRREARRLAEDKGCSLMITDGPPGLGCPVIASLADASRIILIAEPSCSGLHDAQRLIQLAKHFGCPVSVCVNKWDINPELTEVLRQHIVAAGATWLGCIRYSTGFVAAQRRKQTILEIGSDVADDVRRIWSNLCATTAHLEE